LGKDDDFFCVSQNLDYLFGISNREINLI
jgi:hypothetical protein